MKILMLSRIMPAHQNGGMQLHTQQLSEGLVKKGHEVTIWTTAHPDKIMEEVNGVKIHYLDYTKTGSYFDGYWDETKKHLKDNIHKFDIIHSQSSAGIGVVNMGVPMVTTFHGTALDEVKTKINLMILDDPLSFLKYPYLF